MATDKLKRLQSSLLDLNRMRYLKFYNQRFMSLQSYVFGFLVGASSIFFLLELYTTAVLVYVGAALTIPSMGLLTALFTIISVQPMLSSLPDAFMKTVLFQTVCSSILLVLWLATAASKYTLGATLAPNGCDRLPDGFTRHLYIVCNRIGSLQLLAYLSSIALTAYIITLSLLTVKTLDAGHPNVWIHATGLLVVSGRVQPEACFISVNISEHRSRLSV